MDTSRAHAPHTMTTCNGAPGGAMHGETPLATYFSMTDLTASGVEHTTARSLRARSIFCTSSVTLTGSDDSLDRRSKWNVYTRFWITL